MPVRKPPAGNFFCWRSFLALFTLLTSPLVATNSPKTCAFTLAQKQASVVNTLAASSRFFSGERKNRFEIVSSNQVGFYRVFPLAREIGAAEELMALAYPLNLDLPDRFQSESFEIAIGKGANNQSPIAIFGKDRSNSLFFIDAQGRFNSLVSPFENSDSPLVFALGYSPIVQDSKVTLFVTNESTEIWSCTTDLHEFDCTWNFFSQLETPKNIPLRFLKAVSQNILIGLTEGGLKEREIESSHWYQITKNQSRKLGELPYWVHSLSANLNGSQIRIEAAVVEKKNGKFESVLLNYRSHAKNKFKVTGKAEPFWSDTHFLLLDRSLTGNGRAPQMRLFANSEGLNIHSENPATAGQGFSELVYFVKIVSPDRNPEAAKTEFNAGLDLEFNFPSGFADLLSGEKKQNELWRNSFFSTSRILHFLTYPYSGLVRSLEERTRGLKGIETLSLFLLSLPEETTRRLLINPIPNELHQAHLKQQIEPISALYNKTVRETIEVLKKILYAHLNHFNEDAATYPNSVYIPWLKRLAPVLGYENVLVFKNKLTGFLNKQPREQNFMHALKNWIRTDKVHPLWGKIFPFQDEERLFTED